MNQYTVSKIFQADHRANEDVNQLLDQEGIQRDKHLDYTCGLFNESDELVATGSCYQNTLRCLAVNHNYQGEGLMNQLISHLVNYQYERGIFHIYIYTKVTTKKYFSDLGFYEIARVEDSLVFLENKRDAFANYISQLKDEEAVEDGQNNAAIVMNANPFTLGHLALVEKASKENDKVHIFIVSEDSSLIPYEVRRKLIIEGTQHLTNLVYHDTASYIISNATFPSYFLEDEESVIRTQAKLDIEIFIRIAQELGINRRYIGEEPYSKVTNIYNEIMAEQLEANDIECIIIPRLTMDDEAISASKVRLAIKEDQWDQVALWTPQTTFDYFKSPEAIAVIEKIRATDNVIHY